MIPIIATWNVGTGDWTTAGNWENAIVRINGATFDASPAHLSNVRNLDRPPLEEIRYASCYNFTGEKLYPFPAAFVHVDPIPACKPSKGNSPPRASALKSTTATVRSRFSKRCGISSMTSTLS